MAGNSVQPLKRQPIGVRSLLPSHAGWHDLRLLQIHAAARLLRYLARFRLGNLYLRGLRRIPATSSMLDAVLGFHRTYPTLAEAERALAPYANGGHENASNAEHHLALNEAPRPSDYAALYHLGSVLAGAKRVFDAGGNVGNLFYCYSRYLAFRDDLSWRVYDLPQHIEHGSALAKARKVRGLQFANRWDKANGADILIASGSLHYFEKPLPQMVEELAEKPRFILINRTPLTDKIPVAVVQESSSFRVACMLYNREALIRDFERIGYQLVDSWQVAELSLTVPGNPDCTIPTYTGLWLKRKT